VRHDPERLAAAYLGQAMSRRSRGRFEHHLLGCTDCWDKVAAARVGRSAAESLRELASRDLRDRVRAVVETVPDPAAGRTRPRRAMVAISAAAAAAVLVGGG
jgi:Flp pilus assembly protein TadB